MVVDKRTDDAVHLREPGVARDRDPHACDALAPFRRFSACLGPLALGPVEDLHAAVGMLDQGRAALHPVAVVVIGDLAQLADLGAVDMAADDAVGAALMGGVGDHLLEAGDELDGVLDPPLDMLAERPIGQAEPAPGDDSPGG